MQTNLHQIIEYCIDKIVHLPTDPTFVAIVGESGSGKSYFTKTMQEAFSIKGIEYSFLNHDDFLIPRKDREALRNKVYKEGTFAGKTYWEILENWYYLDRFQEVLSTLKKKQTAEYYPYLRTTGDISEKPKKVEYKKIILLENKLFLDQMDFIIELDVDRHKIINRKIERDSDVRTPEQTIEMHEKAQGFFWDRCKPKHPDIVIDNNDFENPKIGRENSGKFQEEKLKKVKNPK